MRKNAVRRGQYNVNQGFPAIIIPSGHEKLEAK